MVTKEKIGNDILTTETEYYPNGNIKRISKEFGTEDNPGIWSVEITYYNEDGSVVGEPLELHGL